MLCYTNMQIICKLANLHIHEYVKYYTFVVKYQIVCLYTFFIIILEMFKSLKQFIMIKHHFQFLFWTLPVSMATLE